MKTKTVTNKGLILVFTGDGKGKTTAALGTALRMIGRGGRVAIVQFFKSRKTAELKPLERLSGSCLVVRFGGGFTWDTSRKVNQTAVNKSWKKCQELLCGGKYDLVIFDEIHIALKYKFLKTAEVIRALKRKPPGRHVILTGRSAPTALLKIADIVTEMKCVKHSFDRGIPAQPGIEY